jgi:hypothetical protein
MARRMCDMRSLVTSEASASREVPGLSPIPLCVPGNGGVESEGYRLRKAERPSREQEEPRSQGCLPKGNRTP